MTRTSARGDPNAREVRWRHRLRDAVSRHRHRAGNRGKENTMTVLDERPVAVPAQAPVTEHAMVVLVGGVQTYTWTDDDTAAMDAARAEFDTRLGQGCMAYTSQGDEHQQVTTFDPAAEKTTVQQALQGG